MSSLKTEHYGLHKWEPGDDFVRVEFNENFESLDGAVARKCEIVYGTYSGSSNETYSTQTVELGWKPRALLVFASSDRSLATYDLPAQLAFAGVSSAKLQITESGFTVRDEMNTTGLSPYRYLAMR